MNATLEPIDIEPPAILPVRIGEINLDLDVYEIDAAAAKANALAELAGEDGDPMAEFGKLFSQIVGLKPPQTVARNQLTTIADLCAAMVTELDEDRKKKVSELVSSRWPTADRPDSTSNGANVPSEPGRQTFPPPSPSTSD